MVDITLLSIIGSIVGGAISAILGAYAYHRIYTKSLRTRIIDALKNELQLNIERIEKNIEHLHEVESGKRKNAILIFPFVTKVYESILIEDPQLFFEITQKTNGQLNEIYAELITLNATYNAMAFGLKRFTGVEEVIISLIQFKKQVEDTLKMLEETYSKKKNIGEDSKGEVRDEMQLG